MRGWYNPHFTHRELKHKVIKVKSFHYFCVLPRTWFLSLFNTLLSVSKAQYALPQLQLWELGTPSRQTRNHPHMRNTRNTQSVITSDKVGFKNLPSTAQKFCGKEADKAQFPKAACDCLHHAAVLPLGYNPFLQPAASEQDGKPGGGPGHTGDVLFTLPRIPDSPRTKVLCAVKEMGILMYHT